MKALGEEALAVLSTHAGHMSEEEVQSEQASALVVLLEGVRCTQLICRREARNDADFMHIDEGPRTGEADEEERTEGKMKSVDRTSTSSPSKAVLTEYYSCH